MVSDNRRRLSIYKGDAQVDPCFLHWYCPSLFTLDAGASMPSRSMGSNCNVQVSPPGNQDENRKTGVENVSQLRTPKNVSFSSRPSYEHCVHCLRGRCSQFHGVGEQQGEAPAAKGVLTTSLKC